MAELENTHEGFRLSYQQQKLWENIQRFPAKTFYSVGVSQIDGQLDVDRLKAALGQMVENFEIFRTTFQQFQDLTLPLQVIEEPLLPDMVELDVSQMTPVEQQEKLVSLLDELCQACLDNAQGPLLRLTLLKISPSQHKLVMVVSALCADAYSLTLMNKLLCTFYEAHSADKVDLQDILQYADIAEWLHSMQHSEEAQTENAFWHHALASTPKNAVLPFEKQASQPKNCLPQSLSVPLSSTLRSTIDEICARYDITPPVFFLTCWHILLGRLTRKPTSVVGVAYDGRTYEELIQSPGLLTKYIPFPCQFVEGMSFIELAKQLQVTNVRIRENQEYFNLDALLSTPQEGYRIPYGFRFALQPEICTADGVSFALALHEERLEVFKVNLTCLPGVDTITLQFTYDETYLTKKDVECLSEQLYALLEQACAKTEQAIADLKMLSDSQRDYLLYGLNRTAMAYPQEECLHQLFQQQVSRDPLATAVVFEDQRLSYQELEQHSNQLAHYLQNAGVKPDTLVGVFIERSLEMVISLLGVLKAGGAYVPLDPQYPRERIAWMFEDAQIELVLTQAHLSDRLPETRQQRICLDTDWDQIAGFPIVSPTSAVTPQNLAYVIYTSGSTGRPKGVMITHVAICNHMYWMQDTLALTPADRVLQKTSFSFDASVWEFYAPLLAGAQLVLARSEEEKNPAYLIETLRDQRISVLQVVPSLLNILLDIGELATCDSLRIVCCGGEELTTILQRALFAQLDVDLYNFYGPTEATIEDIFWKCERTSRKLRVPIGRSIANTQAYVLDEELNPITVGVPGLLYLGGSGLARGYLGKPDATAEKFIPHPFSTTPGERLYNTGDIVRYTPDGVLEYVERADRQVKLHGYRIELHEIEAVLTQQAGVHDAAVMVRQDTPGEQRLTAYVVSTDGNTSSAEEIRRFLEQQLPEYMLPSTFMFLDKLPLTPNGKVDYKQLPAPDKQQSHAGSTYVAPLTEVEQILAEIWAQLLSVEQMGIHDNFFSLGGDSILGIQIASRARQKGLIFAPRQLFKHQTIAQLAPIVTIDTTIAAQPEQGMVSGPLPLTPILHEFSTLDLRNPHYWNQALLFEARQPLDTEKVRRTVQYLMSHHDALRIRLHIHADEQHQLAIQGPDDEVPFIYMDLSRTPAEQQRQAIENIAAQLQTQINMSTGPIMQVALLDLGKHYPARLLFIIHHIAVDGVSWRILLEDFEAVYKLVLAGEEPRLAAKTSSFKLWAERLTTYAQSPAVQQELAYWMGELSKPVAALPQDMDTGVNDEASARTVSVILNEEDTQALLSKVPEIYHTQINDVLLTALLQTFARWTGHNSLLLNLESHGREEITTDLDFSRTVGWFTAHYPVHLHCSDSADQHAMLLGVKEQLRAVPHYGLGYGVLRYLTNTEATSALSALPTPQVAFNYLGQFDQTLDASYFLGSSYESTGLDRDPQNMRPFLLNINAQIVGGKLLIYWSYSEHKHARTTIEAVAQGFIDALQDIIRYCLSSQAQGGYTPSDFPMAGLNQKELDSLFDELEGYQLS